MTKNATALGFLDELEKISQCKQAMSPELVAGTLAGGKIMLTNLIRRHGMEIPLVSGAIKRIGGEALGYGARAGAAGRPMFSAPTRSAMAAILDPSLVKAYEVGHGAGRALGRGGLETAGGAVRRAQETLSRRAGAGNPVAKAVASAAKPWAEVAYRAPTQSTGVRRVLDYLNAPVGEVARDVSTLAKRVKLPQRGGGLPKPEIIGA